MGLHFCADGPGPELYGNGTGSGVYCGLETGGIAGFDFSAQRRTLEEANHRITGGWRDARPLHRLSVDGREPGPGQIVLDLTNIVIAVRGPS